jgi:2-hydroxychromene-2-carboxylate isomerase
MSFREDLAGRPSHAKPAPPGAADWTTLRGDHPLVVYIDLKSPYAYLAIDPTRAMARDLGVTIDWRPFTLDIPSYLGSASLDAKGGVASSERSPQQWSSVRYAYMDARRYASLTGKTVRGTVKIWDSGLAGVSMLWARHHARLDAYLDEVYPRFWRRDLDIEDVRVLELVLRDAGVSTDGFRAYAEGPGRSEHDELNAAAFEAGVFGVPTYLVGDEMWFGREHLPRVAWLLSGAEGPAPRVANRSFGGRPR